MWQSIVCLIFLFCLGCKQQPDSRTDTEKYCDTWNPRPPYCDIDTIEELPEGWNKPEMAPVLEWIQLLLATGHVKVGYQSEPGVFLLKDSYIRVYPVAWKKID